MATLKERGFDDLKIIGRGQYGKAHLVRNEKGVLYIAKTIDLTCLSSKERDNAEQEVALLRRLDHPNIVQHEDSFFMAETLVIVMQYCDGGDLAAYIKEMAKAKTRIRELQIMNYFVQILKALEYIHQEHRILHRDLKTSNLFLMQSRKVLKLGDFGISRVLEGSIEAAITVVGTPYYMSPEVCENKPYTFKSDVWSLGCVLYELCMLKHAFSADNLLGLVYKIVSDKYEPIPQKYYSVDLNTLIHEMLEKNADKRPSVRDLLAKQYVRTFMKDYVRTGGQCAVPSSSVNRQRTDSGGGGSAPSGAVPRSASSSATAGGSASAPASAGAATGGPERSKGARTVASPASAEGGERPAASAQRVAKTSRGSTGDRGGERAGAGIRPSETPKEAMMRRKREKAEKEAESMRRAAQQSVHNKTVARKLKEEQFQSTRLGRLGGTRTGPASPTGGTPAGAAGVAVAGGAGTPGAGHAAGLTGGWAQGADGARSIEDESDGSFTPEEDESIEEEESQEEYEDDFVEDSCTEAEEEVEECDEDWFNSCGAVGGPLSTVHEERDLTRVMSYYEQDLARAENGISPVPRRPSGGSGQTGGVLERHSSRDSFASNVDVPVGTPTPTAASSAGPPGGRNDRIREEIMRKMGAEPFQKAFDYLYNARQRSVEESTVKRELTALIGKEAYKAHGLQLDMLVFNMSQS